MSKELKNIEDNVMKQITLGKIKMKPKMYFIFGSILTFIGLVSTIIVSALMVGLIRFSLRNHGGWRAQYKLEQMINEFPWWIIVIAIIGLMVGIWLIKKYDFTYKIKSWILILGFIFAIVFAGLIMDKIGVNYYLMRGNPMKRMMKIHVDQDIPERGINWRR